MCVRVRVCLCTRVRSAYARVSVCARASMLSYVCLKADVSECSCVCICAPVVSEFCMMSMCATGHAGCVLCSPQRVRACVSTCVCVCVCAVVCVLARLSNPLNYSWMCSGLPA